MTRLSTLTISALAAGAVIAGTGQAAEPAAAPQVDKIELRAVSASAVRSRWKKDPRKYEVTRIRATLAGAPAAAARVTVKGSGRSARTITIPKNGVAFLLSRRTGKKITVTAVGLAKPAVRRLAHPAGPRTPNGALSTSARVLAPVTARARPGFRSKRITVVQPIAPLGGGPTILLVKRSVRVAGRLWLRVLLPIRPNGSEGWIPADVVRLHANRTRIVIRQQSRRIDVYRKGKRVLRFPVAIGKSETPTPYGRFAIAEEIPTNIPGGFLGPFVLPLTGYSKVLNEYAGGNGRVAIHGTSQPQVIGTQASHGCVRLYNSDVRRLAAMVKPGTQVEIRRK